MPSDLIQEELNNTKKELESERRTLKRKKQIAEAQQRFRKRKQAKIAALVEDMPEAQNALKQRSLPGRPPIEEDQPILHKTILEIAVFGSAADDRMRTNVIRSVKTLTDLHEELTNSNFALSRNVCMILTNLTKSDRIIQ